MNNQIKHFNLKKYENLHAFRHDILQNESANKGLFASKQLLNLYAGQMVWPFLVETIM